MRHLNFFYHSLFVGLYNIKSSKRLICEDLKTGIMWEVCGRQKRKTAELKSPTGCQFFFLLQLCAFNKLRATSFSARSAVKQKLASVKVTLGIFLFFGQFQNRFYKVTCNWENGTPGFETVCPAGLVSHKNTSVPLLSQCLLFSLLPPLTASSQVSLAPLLQ